MAIGGAERTVDQRGETANSGDSGERADAGAQQFPLAAKRLSVPGRTIARALNARQVCSPLWPTATSSALTWPPTRDAVGVCLVRRRAAGGICCCCSIICCCACSAGCSGSTVARS
jgi:hypothetical protein